MLCMNLYNDPVGLRIRRLYICTPLVISSVTFSGVLKLLPLFRYDCSRIQTFFPDLRKVCIGRYILQCTKGAADLGDHILSLGS